MMKGSVFKYPKNGNKDSLRTFNALLTFFLYPFYSHLSKTIQKKYLNYVCRVQQSAAGLYQAFNLSSHPVTDKCQMLKEANIGYVSTHKLKKVLLLNINVWFWFRNYVKLNHIYFHLKKKIHFNKENLQKLDWL